MTVNPAALGPSLTSDLLRVAYKQIVNVLALHDHLHRAEDILRCHPGSDEWRRCWAAVNILESKCGSGYFVLSAALDAIRCSN